MVSKVPTCSTSNLLSSYEEQIVSDVLLRFKPNQKNLVWDFLGSPVVKTLCFQCRDAGVADLIPGQGTEIPHAAWCGQKKKKSAKKITSSSQWYEKVSSPL